MVSHITAHHDEDGTKRRYVSRDKASKCILKEFRAEGAKKFYHLLRREARKRSIYCITPEIVTKLFKPKVGVQGQNICLLMPYRILKKPSISFFLAKNGTYVGGGC